MYRFFDQAIGGSNQASEPELTIEKDADLLASPQGQVGAEPLSRTIFSFTSEKAAALVKDRRLRKCR